MKTPFCKRERMVRIIKIVTLKTYVQKALILNGFFMLAQPPGERERTIGECTWRIVNHMHCSQYEVYCI